MIFDTHCHLNHEDLYENRDTLIKDARAANVTKFMVVGYDFNSSVKAIDISNEYDCCFAAIGFHPTELDNLDEKKYNKLFDMINNNKKIKAIGEIGLDYHWVSDPVLRDIQKEYFIRQIETANEVGLPIIIHCRDAIDDCLQILKQYKPMFGGIMHCYSGSVESMKEFIKLGLLISFGGSVTFTNAKTPKEAAEDCPLDCMVVETDSPYLTPHPFRGTKNEPKLINFVLDEISNLKHISKKHLEDVTYNNSMKVFGINEK